MKKLIASEFSIGQILPIVLAAVFLGIVGSSAMAKEVLAGYDYLSTCAGTEFNMSSLGGIIPLQGNPLGLSPNTHQPYDTIVRRLETAHIDAPSKGGPLSDNVSVQMTALSLVSIEPVDISGTFFNVYVNLSSTTPSMGTMTIRHEYEDMGGPPCSTYLGIEAASGTFDSFFDIFFDVALGQVGGGLWIPIVHDTDLALSSTDTFWTHDGDKFLLGNPVIEQHPGQGVHVANQVDNVPEPLTLSLLGFGTLGLLKKRRA